MNSLVLIVYLIGLTLSPGYDDLSNNKAATQSHTFAAHYYDATNAVDGSIETCMRTQEIGLSSSYKTLWWEVDLGKVYNIYSVNILFRNYGINSEGEDLTPRQKGRFAGFSLYISNTSGIEGSTLCYKDGPQLPPLNFTTLCREYGRYVIFYNERLDDTHYPLTYEVTNVHTELCEVIVQGCKPEVYGSQCNLSCPTNCKNSICHIENGTCFDCESGWTGNTCSTKCKEGFYGGNCSKQCYGNCRDNTTCDHVTGQCKGGCEEGWTGLLCEKVCNNGTFGYNCVNSCSGHCLNNSPCNKQTGHCDRGCNPGYTSGFCNTECPPGRFGLDCRKRCSNNCVNSEPCDHVSGVCFNGCQDGYVGTSCNNRCEAGYYGKNCNEVCFPNCKTCRHTDGECTCVAGWMGSNCSTECVQSHGENCQYQCSQHCTNQTCDRFNGSCLNGCKKGESCDIGFGEYPMYSSNSLPVIVGGTLGAFVLSVTGVIIAVIVLRLKRKATKISKKEFIAMEMKPFVMEHRLPYTFDNKSQKDPTNIAMSSPHAPREDTKRGPPKNKHISVRNMKAQITNLSCNENTGFKSEYHDIPRGELNQCLEAKKPENKVKNRYTTIYPYDHSRVIIKTSSSSVEGDYINANYIEDARGKRIYIATQGPKPKTISDFWTMIWEEEVCNIVCLTNLKEGAKNKCAQYWPDINDKLQGGTLTVRHLEEKTYAEYTMRRFKIHNKMTITDRHVTMFHYTTWSDHGVADPLSLVVFHRHVIRATANTPGKYTVVHCSAGVGRTGTYIALDALYQEGERTGKINVPMYVRAMRKDRMNMIQGDEQYKLLYLALMEAFSGPSRCMTTEKFVGAYQEQTCYANCGDVVQKSSQSSEFEELLSLRKEYTQQDYASGRAQISASYTQSVLPVEEFMCHLSYIKGHNTYYNAILLQSYLEKDSLISAQYPLQDNTEDFLRLVRDFDARVVVFLCPLKDIESTPAWFPTDNQSKLSGLFFIKNISTIKASNVLLTKLNIQPQGFSEMNITVIECPTWREEKGTADKRVLLDVIKAVKTEKSDQKGRIVVLSSDGATSCGPFFVVYNVLEQISVDREVDIFTAVRQIQVRRPEFVSTLEEYQLCHDTVAEYLLNDCVYGNC